MTSLPSPPAPSRPIAPARLPALDGWRALSIIMVLGAHCTMTSGFPREWEPWFNRVFDAGLGVRAFFVISGLLITWLLLVEREQTGRINLWHFYIRRGLRILPVYAAFLIVLAALQCFTPFQQTALNWLGNAGFFTNFLPGSTWTSGHLWSLGVEEQFYLLWPGGLVLLGSVRHARWVGWILAGVIVAAPACRAVSYLGPASAWGRWFFAPYSFFNYFDSLAFGCVSALLLLRCSNGLRTWLIPRPWPVVFVALTLIVVPHALSLRLVLGVLTVPFGPTMQACGLALLILQSLVMPPGSFYRVLDHPWIGRLGVLSYSLYIWQQIFCSDPAVFGLERAWWMSFPGWLASALLMAIVSYHVLERPWFRLRARFR